MGRPDDIEVSFRELSEEARTAATDPRGMFSAIAHTEFWAGVAFTHGPHLRALCWEQLGVGLLRLAAIASGGSGEIVPGPHTVRMVGSSVDGSVSADDLLTTSSSVLTRAQRLAATLDDEALSRALTNDLAVLASFREGLVNGYDEDFSTSESPMPVFFAEMEEPPVPVVEPSSVWANALRPIAIGAHVTEMVDRAARASGSAGPDPRQDAANNLVIDAYLRARETVTASGETPSSPPQGPLDH